VSAHIKITGDTKEIKKSLLSLSNDVKDLGKSKVAIFDKSQKSFLETEMKRHMNDLKKQIQSNNSEIKKAVKEQNKSKKSVEGEVKARENMTKLIQKQVSLQKELNSLDMAGKTVAGGPGMMGRMGRRLGPAGAALAAGGFLASRGARAYNEYQKGVGTRVGLMGRGVSDMDLRDEERASRAGMSAQDVRRARLSSMDVFGRKGAEQEAVIQRAEMERNFGLQQGTFGQMGGQLRGQFGGQQAGKEVMAIQAGLLASGITDEIGPYLETATTILKDLNENGFTFTDSALVALNKLTMSGEMSPERAGRMISGMDKAIRGSTGETNAFFQSVFGKAGIGGGTVGGIQAGIRSGGLFGADFDKGFMSPTDKMAFGEMGIGGRTGQKVAQSTTKLLDQMFGNEEEVSSMLKSPEEAKRKAGASRRMQRLNFVMNTFGLESEYQGAEVNRMLTELGDPETSERRRGEIKKRIQETQSGNTQLGNLKTISKSNEGIYQETKKLHETVRDEFGSTLSPVMNSLDKTMMSVDSSMLALLDWMGIKTPEQEMKERLLEKAETGEALTPDELERIKKDPKLQKELSQKSIAAQGELGARIAEKKTDIEKREGDFFTEKTPMGQALQSERRAELGELEKKKAGFAQFQKQVDPESFKKEQEAKRKTDEKKDQENKNFLDKFLNIFENGKPGKVKSEDFSPLVKGLSNIGEKLDKGNADRKKGNSHINKLGGLPATGGKT